VVLVAFLISCTVLGTHSAAGPSLAGTPKSRRSSGIGVPVQDYNSQSTMFTLCILGLAQIALRVWHKGKRFCALLCVLLATGFFANTLYAATSRTALVVLPFLLALFAVIRLSWKSAGALLIAIIIVLVAAWQTSDRLRERRFVGGSSYYQTAGVPTSAGYRLGPKLINCAVEAGQS